MYIWQMVHFCLVELNMGHGIVFPYNTTDILNSQANLLQIYIRIRAPHNELKIIVVLSIMMWVRIMEWSIRIRS